MKILHIYSGKYSKTNGIITVLKKLIIKQNELANIKSELLFFNKEIIQHDFGFCYYNFYDYSKFKNIIKKNNYDVCVFHAIYYKEYLNLSEILRFFGVKYIIKPHGSLLSSAQKFKKVKKTIANFILFNKFVKLASGISFLSIYESENSLLLNNDSFIVTNGSEISSNQIRNKTNTTKYLFIGRINYYQKGLDRLLFLFCKLKNKNLYENIFVDIYGDGRPRDINKLTKTIEKKKLSNVKFHGPVFEDDKKKVYEQHDILILPSRSEGFPMVLLEAFSFGLPCLISSDLISISKIVEKNNLGWVFSDAKILEVFEQSIEDYKTRKNEFFYSVKKYILENHDWRKIAKQSIQEYEKIVLKNEK